ncbi:formylglycine-generating enzyme family protein [Pseudorhizobium endolithicum]|uniref:Formylglycine-generating enzyme family protein n=2 Tax=Pseudorhizobium endolithicum TaxID=1191678 RepID=A0ABM8PM80_9HYPH|nr:formylglycine-generating enzyme family protein [Pseudorhizobium endolithicum]
MNTKSKHGVTAAATDPENQHGSTACCSALKRGYLCRSDERGLQSPKIKQDGSRGDVVLIPGARSFVGSSDPVIALDGEGPKRRVQVAPFSIARHAVSGTQFRAFVNGTGYVTEAERFGWSFVFHLLLRNPSQHEVPPETPWWRKVDGACWRHPEGPGSDLEGREDHPVVHISWADANAYARWCGGRLPTEAEWEHAARGGLDHPRYPWGDEEPTDQRVFCNIWQGNFPHTNSAVDGYVGTAPVESFSPNGYGLFNMVGNVWEWCSDPFKVRSVSKSSRRRNLEALRFSEKVMKGGSYLCHISYCYRYRIAARSGRPADTSAGNTGFRVAYDA